MPTSRNSSRDQQLQVARSERARPLDAALPVVTATSTSQAPIATTSSSSADEGTHSSSTDGRPSNSGSGDSRNVYVCNLPVDFSTDDLRARFSAFGRVVSTKLIVDIKTGQSRGFGFVLFSSANEASKCIEAMDGHQLDGEHKIVTRLADPRTRHPGTPTDRVLVRNLPPNATDVILRRFADAAVGVRDSIVTMRILDDGSTGLRVAWLHCPDVATAQRVAAALNNCVSFPGRDAVPRSKRRPILARVLDRGEEFVRPPSPTHVDRDSSANSDATAASAPDGAVPCTGASRTREGAQVVSSGTGESSSSRSQLHGGRGASLADPAQPPPRRPNAAAVHGGAAGASDGVSGAYPDPMVNTPPPMSWAWPHTHSAAPMAAHSYHYHHHLHQQNAASSFAHTGSPWPWYPPHQMWAPQAPYAMNPATPAAHYGVPFAQVVNYVVHHPPMNPYAAAPDHDVSTSSAAGMSSAVGVSAGTPRGQLQHLHNASSNNNNNGTIGSAYPPHPLSHQMYSAWPPSSLAYGTLPPSTTSTATPPQLHHGYDPDPPLPGAPAGTRPRSSGTRRDAGFSRRVPASAAQ